MHVSLTKVTASQKTRQASIPSRLLDILHVEIQAKTETFYQNVGYFCLTNTPRIRPASLPSAINSAINEHNDDGTTTTFHFAHRAFHTARHYK